MRFCLIPVLVIFAVAAPCKAGFFSVSCSHCGCGQVKKVCRMVPDVKKITETKYVVEEEDVCLPGKSCTEERLIQDNCAPNGQRCEKVQIPRCGRIVCKKKLKKTTTTVEKPTFKCVVEAVCCQCGCVTNSGNCGQ